MEKPIDLGAVCNRSVSYWIIICMISLSLYLVERVILCFIKVKGKGKRCVFIVQITPVGSADLTLITPRCWNTLSQSHLTGDRCSAIFYSWSHSHSTNFCSTWCLLLLGGQRRCGFKAIPRLLHMTDAVGIETQTPRSLVQCPHDHALHVYPMIDHYFCYK